MKKIDALQRFIFENSPVRGEYVHLTDTFQTIVAQHQYPEPIKRLLGEALAVTALLRAIVKFNGRLTLQFRGKGKLKMLLVQSENNFRLRGLIKWDGLVSYKDLMAAFKEGVLLITINNNDNKQYQGIVAFKGKTLAESIEGYFEDSEQIATKIWLGVDENRASGLLLQKIPDVQQSFSQEPEVYQTDWAQLIKQTDAQINAQKLLNQPFEILLNHLYKQETIRIFQPHPVSFGCSCNIARSEDAILLLGEKEANEEIKDKQTIVVTCDFCNREYIFDKVDIARIFKNKSKGKLH